ncbi:MAG TPA: hypothetical protein VGD58_31235 [Herpetosiphonaceae bacterium]
MRTRLYSLLALLALSTIAWIAPPTQAAAPQPVFQYAETITPATGSHKFPSATVANGQLHVVWATPNQANHAVRAEAAQGFAITNPVIGSIGGNSSFFNAATTSRNGVVHVVWIDNGGTIRHRSNTGGAWSDTHTAATGQNFANYISTTIASNGRIFAAWRHQGSNPDAYIGFSFSDNGGVSWSGMVDVALPRGTYAGVPSLAAGPSGQVFLSWTGVDGNVYVGEFDGSTFVPVKVTSTTNNFNPTVTAAPSGQPVAAWRNIQQGVFVGYRNAAGQWTVENPFPHNGVAGPVSIVADAQNNLHLAWISQQAGNSQFEAWYSFKTPADPWTTPQVVSRDGPAFKANLSMTATLSSGTALAHIFWESFAGGQFIRYAQVKTQVSVPLSGRLTINNGAAFTNQQSVNVTITNTSTGPATSYSLADGVDPGAPASAFANPSVNTTLNLNTSDGQCRVHTIYGRLGDGSSVSPMFAGTITYDPSARITAQARNPNVAFNQPLNDFNVAMVPSGDVFFTREERFNLLVNGAMEECSGVKSYAIVEKGEAKPAAGDPAWRAINGGYVSANVQFTAGTGQGIYEFDVYARDMVDNETTAPTTVQIAYDNEAPAVTGASATMPTTMSTRGGIATVTVGTPSVTDNMFPGAGAGKGYWGYWVAVKATDDGAPSTTEWDSYGEILFGELPSTLRWNMADGLVGNFEPNTDYTIYIRYLDGAGNGSTAMKSASVNVARLEFFTHIPLTSK